MITTTERELLWPAMYSGSAYTIPAVYAERVREPRYVGRCKVSGCKHRTAVNAVTFLQPASPLGSVRPYEVTVVATGQDERPWAPMDFRFSARNPSAFEQCLRNEFERLGLLCPDHGASVKLRGVRGTIAQNVKCTSRCHNATSDTCDCECGGQAHGKNWQLH